MYRARNVSMRRKAVLSSWSLSHYHQQISISLMIFESLFLAAFAVTCEVGWRETNYKFCLVLAAVDRRQSVMINEICLFCFIDAFMMLSVSCDLGDVSLFYMHNGV